MKHSFKTSMKATKQMTEEELENFREFVASLSNKAYCFVWFKNQDKWKRFIEYMLMGMTCNEIGSLLGIHRMQVYYWKKNILKTYNNNRILENMSIYRKRKNISETDWKILKRMSRSFGRIKGYDNNDVLKFKEYLKQIKENPPKNTQISKNRLDTFIDETLNGNTIEFIAEKLNVSKQAVSLWNHKIIRMFDIYRNN